MVTSLRLQNFRSYSDKLFTFASNVNVIVGPNASGKTNILEAILFSQRGTSYRAKDIELISFNKEWARIDCQPDRIIKLKKDSNPTKEFEINGQIYKRLPSSVKLPVVLFEPNHLYLLNGSPDGRRTYLDSFIDQIDGFYGPMLRKYQRALAQRNSLLKSPQRPSLNQLFPWNIRLSQLAGQLVKARQQLIDTINQHLPSIYNSLSLDKVKTELVYQPQLAITNYESTYLKKLEAELNVDLRTGFTTYGPHRDDFSFLFNNHPSQTYASRGELRTAMLALKVSELEIIQKIRNEKPIILFDDVYSELDKNRRQALTGYLKTNQSFITTTDADVVKRLAKTSQFIRLG